MQSAMVCSDEYEPSSHGLGCWFMAAAMSLGIPRAAVVSGYHIGGDVVCSTGGVDLGLTY